MIAAAHCIRGFVACLGHAGRARPLAEPRAALRVRGGERRSRPGTIVRFAAALALVLAALPLRAQQQFQGVCANVKVEILQELAIERIGFEATLEITNNVGDDPITDFSAQLTFGDPDDVVNGVPRDVADRFFVQRPRLSSITAIDGTGVIGPTQTAIIKWFIIPKPDTGGTDPRGKLYEVGVRMAGKSRGDILPANVLFAIPDQITVRPEPQLDITYFQPRDVQGDDPFTLEVETPIPFTLGVLVSNSGYGVAKSLRINSQQPKIVENRAGLLLIARLLGARVQDAPLVESSLEVNLGDIDPGRTKKGAWDMITSLSGEFIEFKASYTHRDDLGGTDTSLIKSLEAHFIAREVLNNDPGRDAILDFLADTDRDELMLPDTLYESEGPVLPVNHWPDAAVTTPLSGTTFGITVNAATGGWGYVRLDDPGQAKLAFASVVRSDGKVIHPRNVWTNIRYRPTDNAKLTYFNLLDKVASPGAFTYTVNYATPPVDTEAPVTRLRFAGQVSEVAGQFHVTRDTQLYFTSEDASPVSIVYRLDDAPAFIPAVPFRLTTPGVHLVRYRATDSAGNAEVEKTATVVLESSGPAFGEIDVLSGALSLTGDTLSFRSSSIALGIPVAASTVAIDAQVDVFKGIRVWPTLAGVPVSPTPATTTTLVVGGENVAHYKYRLGSGAWSAERTVATPLTLTGLAGAVTIDVLARAEQGGYPAETDALRTEWTVDAAAPAFTLSGMPPTPARAAPGPITVQASGGVELFRWRADDSYWRAETAPGAVIEFPLVPAGTHAISLIARRGGVWQEETAASVRSWLYDPAYGSDMTSLPLVYSHTFTGVQGTTVSFAWDGRDQGGVLQTPGWYTVCIRLTDALGNAAFVNQLVRIEDLAATTTPVAEAGTGPERPDARGGWLVWQERGSGTPNIRAQQVGVSGSTPVSITDLALAQENPRTDGRYAVWQSRGENGTWDVSLVDLTDPGVIFPLTSSTTRNEINPVVDWPWVVWQARDAASPSAPWQLEATNLETAQVFTVDATTTDQLDPAIDAGRVVWQDFRDVGFGEIYFRDLETGEQRRLTNNTFGQYAPDIDGHWVVWQDNRHTQVEIYGLDLRRGVETRLTDTPANEARPRLANNWVLFTEDSAGPLAENFVILDLGTGRSVPLTRSTSTKSRGSIAAGRIFWQRGASGSSVVESAVVPALQPVFTNNNGIAVSPALVASHAGAFSLLNAWHADAGVTTISRFLSLSPLVVENATIEGGAPSGTNFPLVAGQFLWVQFGANHLVDLGAASSAPIDLPAGIVAFGHTGMPLDFTGHALVRSFGLANVRGIRVLDAQSGQWRLLAVEGGVIRGADFRVPTVAVIIADLINPIAGWKP